MTSGIPSPLLAGPGQPGGQCTILQADMIGAVVNVHLATSDVAHVHDDGLAVGDVIRYVLGLGAACPCWLAASAGLASAVMARPAAPAPAAPRSIDRRERRAGSSFYGCGMTILSRGERAACEQDVARLTCRKHITMSERLITECNEEWQEIPARVGTGSAARPGPGSNRRRRPITALTVICTTGLRGDGGRGLAGGRLSSVFTGQTTNDGGPPASTGEPPRR